jgi:multisubunit Na+/H+ antiporter MnhG subunit
MESETASTADKNGQLIVSSAIVGVLGTLGMGLIVSAVLMKDWTQAGIAIGTIVGALGNALTAPSGIGNVIRSAKTVAPVEVVKPAPPAAHPIEITFPGEPK